MLNSESAVISTRLILLIFFLFFAQRTFSWIRQALRIRSLAATNHCSPVAEYPHNVPYLGFDFIVRIVKAYRARRVLETFETFSNQVGHTFGFWLLGKRWLITSEPENVKAILGFSVEDFERGARRHWGFEPLTGDALHTADGPQWTAARAMFRPFFAKTKICDLVMIERHFKDLLKALPKTSDVSVDLQALFPCLTMDITTEMLFGSPTQTLLNSNNKDIMAFARACEYAQKVTWRRIALGWAAAVLPDKEYKQSLRLIDNVVDKYVQQALDRRQNHEKSSKDQEDGREIFSEHLAEHTQNPKVLKDLLLGALLGGRDTASYLLSNLFHVLARKPDVWQKLRTEATKIGSGSITQEDLKKTPYARNCVQECKLSRRPTTFTCTPSSYLRFEICISVLAHKIDADIFLLALRLHPVVPGNQRWCNKETVLPRGGGANGTSPIVIPRGSETIVNVWAMHRRRDIWGDDADEFKPERWDGLNPGWAYVPFSAGPKICIGSRQFAQVVRKRTMTDCTSRRFCSD